MMGSGGSGEAGPASARAAGGDGGAPATVARGVFEVESGGAASASASAAPPSSAASSLLAWLRGLRLPDDVKLPLFLLGVLAAFFAVWVLRDMLIPFSAFVRGAAQPF